MHFFCVVEHASLVHAFESSQRASLAVPKQIPEMQVSPVVHAIRSSHGPLAADHEHWPFDVLQESFVQTFPSLQSFGSPAHVPVVVLHVSETVQGLPSSQAIGVVTGEKTHPLPATHLLVVHEFLSSHAESFGWLTQPKPDWQ